MVGEEAAGPESGSLGKTFGSGSKCLLKSGKGQNTGQGFQVQERARVPKSLGKTMVRVGF